MNKGISGAEWLKQDDAGKGAAPMSKMEKPKPQDQGMSMSGTMDTSTDGKSAAVMSKDSNGKPAMR